MICAKVCSNVFEEAESRLAGSKKSIFPAPLELRIDYAIHHGSGTEAYYMPSIKHVSRTACIAGAVKSVKSVKSVRFKIRTGT
jgi:hypothetical protein